ncbi:MAG: tetratricopeptide repeat protein [bacterium]
MEGVGVLQSDAPRDHRGVNERLQEGLRAFEDCRWRDAILPFQEVMVRHPDRHEIAGKLAFALSQVGEYDQAIRILIRLSSHEPRTARWPYMIGYQFYRRARWPEAIQWFDKALLLNPGYVKALYRKGYAHFRLDQTEECEKALKACIEHWNRLPPELQQAERRIYGKANSILGKTYLAQGLSLKAKRPLHIAVQMDGDDPDRRYELGQVLASKR